ncbi:unnamed protein product [Knipowitschia caucasica]|uniref:HP domain-containing protein n=1 Tax=Knipowitschia caucasica TaxID=637954 RepID=A0AAV2KIW4_KNICA
MENPVLEPRAERIARYKAERRRELAERFGVVEELPVKWTRTEAREGQGEQGRHRGMVTSESEPALTNRLHSRTRANGLEADELSHHRRPGPQDGVEGEVDGPQLHTRVSVGQLRSALLQQRGTPSDQTSAPDAASASLDLALRPGSEARRRTRRYLPSGSTVSSRKTSDRFRTQPITATEREQSSGVLDEVEEEDSKGDVKTDDRAKMSVAAKMSLFKELEKSAPASSFLKPRSGSVSHERRARRSQDHRFMTQPITCEEMGAISIPKAAPVPAPAPAPAPASAAAAAAVEPECTDPELVEDESCKMSMSEKLALFNKLSLPERMAGGPTESAPDRRRQKGARYRTQPITVEEVGLLQKGPVQLPAFSLAPHLSERQQALSNNLKPSEVRRSHPKLDPSAEYFSPQSNPHLPHTDSELGLRSILKKSGSGGSEWAQTDTAVLPEQNGGERDTFRRKEERQEVTSAQQRANVDGATPGRAPWRQRARGRRETIACTSLRPETDAGAERLSALPVLNGLESGGLSIRQREAALTARVSLHDSSTEPKPITNGRRAKDDSDIAQDGSGDGPQSWGPVFASVFSSSRPQYIMCFNQTSQSFEAQEVASPAPNSALPLWRKKENDDESSGAETHAQEQKRGAESPVDEQRDKNDLDLEFEACLPDDTAVSAEVKDVPRACEPHPSDGGFHGDLSSLAPCVPPPRDASAAESQDVFCQTNTNILTSAVAEHRRSVRPSRRTQGSRNPLRALAARADLQDDFMGDSADERLQAQQKSKNCSSSLSKASNCGNVSGASRETNKNLMLVHIKGRRHVQVRLVEPSVRSLNSGDCYLLVTPEHCIVWSGEFANEQEKAKARELSVLVQSQRDLGCRATRVVQLEEGLNSDSAEASDFWSLLGGRTQYRGASAPEEDEEFERGVSESNCVYRLVEDRLVPHEEAWACAPTASLLEPTEALVLDFGGEVYLWTGQDVSPSRRSVALQLAQQVWSGPYDYSNCQLNPLDPTQSNPAVKPTGEGRPAWALFSLISQHSETALFREKFVNWTKSGAFSASEAVTQESQPQPGPSDLSPCDAKALVSGRSTEREPPSVLSGGDVSGGNQAISLDVGRQTELSTLAVDTWLVQEFDDTEVPVESTGQLHEKESYVIRWTYSFNCSDKTNGLDSALSENTAFFLWRGRHSNASGRDTAAFLSIDSKHQEAAQVVVPQGSEPPRFLQLFSGGLVIHKGTREEAVSRTGDWRLFVVRGELPEEASLSEVDCCCAGLRSRGSVVLLNAQQGALYQWIGCKAQASTKEVGRRTVERLTQTCPPELGLSRSSPLKVQKVEEGSEPAEFWTALGHMDRKAYDCMLQDPGKYNFTPRLFHLSASAGSFKAEERQSPSRMPGLVMTMPFVQEILLSAPQPALFLLDNRLEVYLWQRGQPDQSDAAAWSLWQNERRCAMETALQYCKEMNPRRPPQAYFISEGTEPLTFTNVFPNWDRSLGPQAQGEEGRLKLTLVQDVLAQLMRTHFPLEQLSHSPLPAGVDPQHLEVYLSDQGFQTLLEMKRDDHGSLN